MRKFSFLFVFTQIIFFSSVLYGADHLKEFGLRKSYAEKLFKEADIQNPSPLALTAYDVYIYAEDLYRDGDYRESRELLDRLWKKYPAGSNDWNSARIDDSLLNVGSPICYYSLRMLSEAVDWKLKEKKNPVKNPKTIQFTVILAGKSEGIQPQNLKDLQSKKGLMKTNTLHPKLKESNFKVVHTMMWLFREYITAITEGKLNVKTEVAYLKNLTIPEACEKANCSPTGDYLTRMKNELSEEILANTDFYWLIHPSHVPDQISEFNNMGFVTGGMGKFNNAPLWISDDLSHIRKRLAKLGTPYREEEHRTYFSQWMMHEYYHYIFKLYPEFGLEKESHQWFKRNLWPADFKGQFEPDYYTEALHKRIIPKGAPLSVKLRIAERSSEYAEYISPDSIEGTYEIKKIENGWHKGKIVRLPGKNSFQWINGANVKWTLELNSKKGILETGKENPYWKNGEKAFKIFLKKDSDGDIILKKGKNGEKSAEIEGFYFNNGTYYKK